MKQKMQEVPHKIYENPYFLPASAITNSMPNLLNSEISPLNQKEVELIVYMN